MKFRTKHKATKQSVLWWLHFGDFLQLLGVFFMWVGVYYGSRFVYRKTYFFLLFAIGFIIFAMGSISMGNFIQNNIERKHGTILFRGNTNDNL